MTAYLRYVIKNEEPLRIADNATSHSGQSDSLRYISGTAMQGYIVSALCGREDFNSIKKELLSTEMAYLNAYLTTGEHVLIPSPKGFYEDKSIVDGEKPVQNVVINGDFSDGMKRASLGRFAYIEDGCIHYYNVRMESEMKNLINPAGDQKRNVFRNEMIAAGHCFEGYVRLGASPEVNDLVMSTLEEGKTIRIGNARSAGMGLCRVVESEKTDMLPWQEKGFRAEGSCYMMLLSDTAMRNEKGENCGLDLNSLEAGLGIKNLEITFASSSVRSVHGYNRTWQSRLPSVRAYEAGSVFHFKYDGTIEQEAMETLCDCGIGIRRTEGFGRILFLQDYENVNRKLAETYCYKETAAERGKRTLDPEEVETLKQTAHSYYKNQLRTAEVRYVVSTPLKKSGVARSKIGSIEAILLQNRYDPSQAVNRLREFFGHEEDKEQKKRIQKERATLEPLEKQLMKIIDRPLTETLSEGILGKELPQKSVMGLSVRDFYTEEEEAQDKLRLIVRMIRYDRK